MQWFVGGRDGYSAKLVIDDLATRLATRVQLTSDGLRAYLEAVEAVEGAFGADIDYAQLVKLYGEAPGAEKRYSPAECIGCRKSVVELLGEGVGQPREPAHTHPHGEVLPLDIGRADMGRIGVALMSHVHMVALYTVWYNWVRIHKTLRITPAMAAGLSDRLMTMEDVVALIDAREAPPRSAGRTRKSRLRFQTETLPMADHAWLGRRERLSLA